MNVPGIDVAQPRIERDLARAMERADGRLGQIFHFVGRMKRGEV
jgi:hypothetical protein